MHYEIARLNDDDTASAVRFGFTHSENSAAHVALATTQEKEFDTCVVEVTNKGERIVQRIKRKNNVTLAYPPQETMKLQRRLYYGPAALRNPDTLEFMCYCIERNYMMTVTPTQSEQQPPRPNDAINIVAVLLSPQ